MTPEIKRIQKRLRLGRPISAKDVQITHTAYKGERVSFCTDMENDPIQRNHRKGSFYEIAELEEIAKFFKPGTTFVDIGANVGNHTIYAARFLNAARVIPFEPNPRAYRLLVQNVLLNRLEEIVDLSKLGVGIADRSSQDYEIQKRERNLGAARLIPQTDGTLQVFAADELLADDTPSFIKIDIEGMELQALAGLQLTIERCAPHMMVEVDLENEDMFLPWIADAGYEILSTRQRYRKNKNYLIRPQAEG